MAEKRAAKLVNVMVDKLADKLDFLLVGLMVDLKVAK